MSMQIEIQVDQRLRQDESVRSGILLDIPEDGHFLTVAEVKMIVNGDVVETKRLYVARQDRHNKIHLAV